VRLINTCRGHGPVDRAELGLRRRRAGPINRQLAVPVDAGVPFSAVLATRSEVTPGLHRASHMDKVRFFSCHVMWLMAYKTCAVRTGFFLVSW